MIELLPSYFPNARHHQSVGRAKYAKRTWPHHHRRSSVRKGENPQSCYSYGALLDIEELAADGQSRQGGQLEKHSRSRDVVQY